MANVEKVKKSKTTAELAKQQKNILFIQRLMAQKASNFETSLSVYRASQLKGVVNPPQETITKIENEFRQEYYKPEYRALYRYEAMKDRHKELENTATIRNLSDAEKDELQELSLHTKVDEVEYITQSMFVEPTISELKSSNRKIHRDLESEIRKIASRPSLSSMPKTKAKDEAAGILFKNENPGIVGQLRSMYNKATTPEAKENIKMGLNIASKTMAVLNPAPYIIAKGVGAILSSSAFDGLRKDIASNLKNMSGDSRLSKAIRNKLADKDSMAGPILKGVLAASIVAAVTAGVLESDQGLELQASMSDYINGVTDISIDGPALPQENALPEPIDEARSVLGNELSSEGAQNDQELNSQQLNDGAEQQNTELDLSLGLDEDLGGGAQPQLSSLDIEGGFESELKAAFPGVEVPNSDIEIPLRPEDEVLTNEAPKLSQEATGDIDKTISADVAVNTVATEIVKPGDALELIVERQLQAQGVPYDRSVIEDFTNIIAEHNGLDSKHIIHPGQEIGFVDLTQGSGHYPELLSQGIEASGGLIGEGFVTLGNGQELDDITRQYLESNNVAYDHETLQQYTDLVFIENNFESASDLKAGMRIDMLPVENGSALNMQELLNQTNKQDILLRVYSDCSPEELKDIMARDDEFMPFEIIRPDNIKELGLENGNTLDVPDGAVVEMLDGCPKPLQEVFEESNDQPRRRMI